MKVNIFTLIIISVVLQVKAQSRILPIIESPSSPKSLSLGNSKMGNMDNSFIYNNPTALFNTSLNNVDYSLGIIPSGGENTYLFHTLTAGYRNKKSAFFVGTRYLLMGSFDNWITIDMQEDESFGKMQFYSYTIDLAYAYKLNNSFSFYYTMGYAEEKTISSIRAYRMDIGSYYNSSAILFNRDIKYSIGVTVANFGKYSYRSKTDFLCPNIRVGGSAYIPTTTNQSMEVFLDGGVYLPVSENKYSSSFSTGIDYSFNKKYSFRLGGHLGDYDDFFSAGFGFKYRLFDFSLGSKIALHDDLNNAYMLGLKIGI